MYFMPDHANSTRVNTVIHAWEGRSRFWLRSRRDLPLLLSSKEGLDRKIKTGSV